jgi:hypothetical protein
VRASLGMLADIKRRWPDLPVADEADALLDEYAARSEQPWVEDGKAEQLRESQFLAQAYEAAARVRYGLTKVQRAIYAQHAIDIYTIIARDTKQENESDTALQRIHDLRPIADNIPTKK